MDFTFPKEMQAFRRMVREFAEEEIAPLAKTIDREHRVPKETIPKLARLGLIPLLTSEPRTARRSDSSQ
jgi:butyryl-CoA dehydrogenase